MSDAFESIVDGWLFRIQPPEKHDSRQVLLAIHGWTGNQFSMDIFTLKLREHYWIIFPRAPYPAQGGGFSWIPGTVSDPKDTHYLAGAARELHSRIDLLLREDMGYQSTQPNLMGFSQGSAMALLYSLNHLTQPSKIVLMSGFLPAGLAATPASLAGHSFLITHGKKDSIIPVDEAHRLSAYVEDCGGQVKYCEADTGHKLGKDCLNRMQEFLF